MYGTSNKWNQGLFKHQLEHYFPHLHFLVSTNHYTQKSLARRTWKDLHNICLRVTWFLSRPTAENWTNQLGWYSKTYIYIYFLKVLPWFTITRRLPDVFPLTNTTPWNLFASNLIEKNIVNTEFRRFKGYLHKFLRLLKTHKKGSLTMLFSQNISQAGSFPV